MGFLVLQFVVIPAVLFLAAYFTTALDCTLNRMAFFVRLLILLAAGTALVFVVANQPEEGFAGVLIVLLGGLVIGFFNMRFQIMRLQDVGWSRFLALLSYVPLVNLIFVLVLLFVPGRPKLTPDVFS